MQSAAPEESHRLSTYRVLARITSQAPKLRHSSAGPDPLVEGVAAPGLTNLMRSGSSDVRLHAVRCLYWMERTPANAEPALRSALADSEPLVRDTAIAALHRMGLGTFTNTPAQ